MADPVLDKITERVIGCAYKVSNALGIGFVEKVYENALFHEMKKEGLAVVQQFPVKVKYDSVIVGEFFLDILVNEVVIVELKAVSTLNNEHLAQAFNYLRATQLPVCLLINFGQPKIQLRRLYPSPAWKLSK
ncbi:MAG: GxxExxY protein [Anaerolineales bacterium]